MKGTDTRKPYGGQQRSLVIALDVGTTFSGVSYAILEPREVPKIHGVTRFPGQEHVAGNSKIPSIVHYDQAGNFMAAGAEAETSTMTSQAEDNGWMRVELFKLRLRPKSMKLNMNGMRLSSLPGNKTATDVFGDFLGYLFSCTKKFFVDTHANGPALWKAWENEIQFVLSHPNGWEGAQQTKMRRAAIYGGLIPDTDEGKSRIRFVTEGEASLHACILNGLAADVLSNSSGQGFIVADAGGGTLDISTYAIRGTVPLVIEEIAPPDCVFSGSVFVSRRARAFLEVKLKDSKYGTPDSVDHITKRFDETTKRLFRNKNELQFVPFGSPLDKDMSVGIRGGQLKLTGQEVADLFAPSVEAAVNSIKAQIEASNDAIQFVWLVGGFAASPWLFNQLTERFSPLGITVCRPDTQTSKAVADGAIGFYCDHHVSARMSKYMYGVEFLREFDPADPTHVERRNKLTELPSGPKLLPDAFDCILARGVKVKESTMFSRKYCTELTSLTTLSVFEVEVWCFRGGNNIPQWIMRKADDFSTLCVVRADLSLLSGSAEPKQSKNGKTYWTIVFSVEIQFGLTEFRARIKWLDNGRTKYGPASIIYNEMGVRLEEEDAVDTPLLGGRSSLPSAMTSGAATPTKGSGSTALATGPARSATSSYPAIARLSTASGTSGRGQSKMSSTYSAGFNADNLSDSLSWSRDRTSANRGADTGDYGSRTGSSYDRNSRLERDSSRDRTPPVDKGKSRDSAYSNGRGDSMSRTNSNNVQAKSPLSDSWGYPAAVPSVNPSQREVTFDIPRSSIDELDDSFLPPSFSKNLSQTGSFSMPADPIVRAPALETPASSSKKESQSGGSVLASQDGPSPANADPSASATLSSPGVVPESATKVDEVASPLDQPKKPSGLGSLKIKREAEKEAKRIKDEEKRLKDEEKRLKDEEAKRIAAEEKKAKRDKENADREEKRLKDEEEKRLKDLAEKEEKRLKDVETKRKAEEEKEAKRLKDLEDKEAKRAQEEADREAQKLKDEEAKRADEKAAAEKAKAEAAAAAEKRSDEKKKKKADEAEAKRLADLQEEEQRKSEEAETLRLELEIKAAEEELHAEIERKKKEEETTFNPVEVTIKSKSKSKDKKNSGAFSSFNTPEENAEEKSYAPYSSTFGSSWSTGPTSTFGAAGLSSTFGNSSFGGATSTFGFGGPPTSLFGDKKSSNWGGTWGNEDLDSSTARKQENELLSTAEANDDFFGKLSGFDPPSADLSLELGPSIPLDDDISAVPAEVTVEGNASVVPVDEVEVATADADDDWGLPAKSKKEKKKKGSKADPVAAPVASEPAPPEIATEDLLDGLLEDDFGGPGAQKDDDDENAKTVGGASKKKKKGKKK